MSNGEKKKPPSLGETRLRGPYAVFKWDPQSAIMAYVVIFEVSFFSQRWRPTSRRRWSVFVHSFVLSYSIPISAIVMNLRVNEAVRSDRPWGNSYQFLRCIIRGPMDRRKRKADKKRAISILWHIPNKDKERYHIDRENIKISIITWIFNAWWKINK